MKIIHLTNNDFDGAGKAVLRLHKALCQLGHNSKMLVYRNYTKSEGVVQVVPGHPLGTIGDIMKNIWFSMPFLMNKLKWYWKEHLVKPKTMINQDVNFVRFKDIGDHIEDCDVICLHSVQLYLSSRFIKKIYDKWKKPLFWTVMDIEPLTGGCHFNNGCLGFAQYCAECPQVSDNGKKTIHRNWMNKSKYLKELPIHIIVPTDWAERQVKLSSLYGNHSMSKILIGVDDQLFHAGDQLQARKRLGIRKDAKVIVFGSFKLMSERKGGKILCKALKILCDQLTENQRSMVTLVTFGNDDGFPGDQLDLEWKHLGFVADEDQTVLIYQAADVYACPSLDDCGPMMINEAIMCATPVVSFNSGVAPDLILNDYMGYLAECYDEGDFAKGLKHCLFNIESKSEHFEQVRAQLTPRAFAQNYISVFERVLN